MEFTSEFIVLLCYFQFCDIYVYIKYGRKIKICKLTTLLNFLQQEF
jgi:hypothetical protein